MNLIKKNIRQLRKKKEMGQAEFGELFGLTRDNIASYERGTEPKIDVLAKIAAYFNTTVDSLIHEDMSDTPATVSESHMTYGSEPKKPTEFVKLSDKREEMQQIPLFNLSASAGLVQLFNNSHQNVLDYISIPNLPKCDGAIHITGDSMYPLLKSGDIVIYKEVNDIQSGIFYGEMYLLYISLNGEEYTTVKYIQRSDLGNNYVKLVSQNQHHSPKDIPIDTIQALAFIKASIRINSMA